MTRSSRRRAGGRRRRPQDAYGKRAQRAGFAARSVYKLEEIDRRLRLLRRGKRVLDLGAAPGSWSAYAAERIGAEGRLVAIDQQPIATALPAHAEAHTEDVHALDPTELGTFDVVLSDMAPSTTGQRDVDQARSHELFMTGLRIAEQVLAPGGAFVGKLFQGPDFEEARAAVRQSFRTVRIIRPRATRSESIETFIAGLDRR